MSARRLAAGSKLQQILGKCQRCHLSSVVAETCAEGPWATAAGAAWGSVASCGACWLGFGVVVWCGAVAVRGMASPANRSRNRRFIKRQRPFGFFLVVFGCCSLSAPGRWHGAGKNSVVSSRVPMPPVVDHCRAPWRGRRGGRRARDGTSPARGKYTRHWVLGVVPSLGRIRSDP